MNITPSPRSRAWTTYPAPSDSPRSRARSRPTRSERPRPSAQASSELVDPHRPVFAQGAVGGESDHQRIACVAHRTGTLRALPHRREKTLQLRAVGRRESIQKITVALSARSFHGRFHRAQRRARIPTDGDAVPQPKQLHPDVVSARVVAGRGHRADDAALKVEQRARGVDVAVLREHSPIGLTVRVDLLDPAPQHPRADIKIVDRQVPPYAA